MIPEDQMSISRGSKGGSSERQLEMWKTIVHVATSATRLTRLSRGTIAATLQNFCHLRYCKNTYEFNEDRRVAVYAS